MSHHFGHFDPLLCHAIYMEVNMGCHAPRIPPLGVTYVLNVPLKVQQSIDVLLAAVQYARCIIFLAEEERPCALRCGRMAGRVFQGRYRNCTMDSWGSFRCRAEGVA